MAKYTGPKKELLLNTIEEMNEVLGFNTSGDPIPTTDEEGIELSNQKLFASIAKDCHTIESGDQESFSEEVWETLVTVAHTLDEVPEFAKEDEEDEKEEDEKEEDEKEEDEEEEDEKEEDEKEEDEKEEDEKEEDIFIDECLGKVEKAKKIEQVRDIAKEAGIRIPPPYLKDLKKMKTYVSGKLEDQRGGDNGGKKAPPAKKVATTKKEKKTPDSNKLSRFEAEAQALLSGAKNPAEKANELYVKSGGKDNIKEANWAHGVFMKVLNALNIDPQSLKK